MSIPASLAEALAVLDLAPICHQHPPLATVDDVAFTAVATARLAAVKS